jgi:hypothetical protein
MCPDGAIDDPPGRPGRPRRRAGRARDRVSPAPLGALARRAGHDRPAPRAGGVGPAGDPPRLDPPGGPDRGVPAGAPGVGPAPPRAACPRAGRGASARRRPRGRPGALRSSGSAATTRTSSSSRSGLASAARPSGSWARGSASGPPRRSMPPSPRMRRRSASGRRRSTSGIRARAGGAPRGMAASCSRGGSCSPRPPRSRRSSSTSWHTCARSATGRGSGRSSQAAVRVTSPIGLGSGETRMRSTRRWSQSATCSPAMARPERMCWWAGAESNCHSRRRGFYRPLGSPPAQPTHARPRSGDEAAPWAAASLPVSAPPRRRGAA